MKPILFYCEHCPASNKCVNAGSVMQRVKWLKDKLVCKNCGHIHHQADWCMAYEDTCNCENEQNETEGMMTEAIIDEAFAGVTK